MMELDPAVAAFADRDGTAFAISRRHLVTANHCVRADTGPVQVLFGSENRGIRLTASVSRRDLVGDIALLDLDLPVPDRYTPYRLAPEAADTGEFRIAGMPRQRGQALDYLDGQIVARTRRAEDGSDTLQLRANQAMAGQELDGYSGAPVIDMGSSVIGVVRERPAAAVGGTLYATPVKRLRLLLAGLAVGGIDALPVAAVSSSGTRWPRRFDVPWALGRAVKDVIVLEDPEEHPTLMRGLNAFRQQSGNVDLPRWHEGLQAPPAGEGWIIASHDAESGWHGEVPDGWRMVLSVHGEERSRTVRAATILTAALRSTRRVRRESRFFARPPDDGDQLMLRHAASDPAAALEESAHGGQLTFVSPGGPRCLRSEEVMSRLAEKLRHGESSIECLRCSIAGLRDTLPVLCAHVAGVLGALGGDVDLFVDDPVAIAWWLAGMTSTQLPLPSADNMRLDPIALRRTLWVGYRLAPALRPRMSSRVAEDWLDTMNAPRRITDQWIEGTEADPRELPIVVELPAERGTRQFVSDLRAAVLSWITDQGTEPMTHLLANADDAQREALGLTQTADPGLPIVHGVRSAARAALLDVAVVS